MYSFYCSIADVIHLCYFKWTIIYASFSFALLTEYVGFNIAILVKKIK